MPSSIPAAMSGRRSLLLVGGAVVLAALALAVVVAPGRPAKVGVSPHTTTTHGLAFLPGAPATPETVPPDTTTVSVAAPVTTTRPVTTTAAPVTTATTSTTVSPVPICRPADLQTVTATDRRTYALGQPVTITVSVDNISGQLCRIVEPYPTTLAPPVRIIQGATVVWQPAASGSGVVASSPEDLAAGASYQWAYVVWAQQQCVAPCSTGTGPPVGAGIYQAVADNPPGDGPPALFVIGP